MAFNRVAVNADRRTIGKHSTTLNRALSSAFP
jgi:hypothetical protein